MVAGPELSGIISVGVSLYCNSRSSESKSFARLHAEGGRCICRRKCLTRGGWTLSQRNERLSAFGAPQRQKMQRMPRRIAVPFIRAGASGVVRNPGRRIGRQPFLPFFQDRSLLGASAKWPSQFSALFPMCLNVHSQSCAVLL